MIFLVVVSALTTPPDIGKQAKGFYIRPSAAIERGGGFFIPGLEGPKLRIAVSGLVVALVTANHATAPSGGPAIVFSELLAVAAAILLALPYVLPEPPPVVEERALVVDPREDAAELRWAVATLAQLTPTVAIALLKDDELVCLSSTPELCKIPTDTPRVDTARDLVRRPDAPRLFGLFPKRCNCAVVVPAKYRTGYVWLLALEDASSLSDDDRGWCARLLMPEKPLLDFGTPSFGGKFAADPSS